jgi:hypothetical protein
MSYLDTLITDLRHSKPAAAGFVSEGLFWGTFAGLVPDIKAAIDASDGQFGLAMFFASLGAVAAMWLAPRLRTHNQNMTVAARAIADRNTFGQRS